ncbi:MAG: glycosyltransferase family 4 protein [Xylanivirga thermophila]|jgi:glycosyltransferase involved in cell wall biosynthesis|uniref:glycosyltransferase family 4 protein n=1 Tax=Xylanivirga thermophila TaxID=2496273 RepID=UPI0039F46531
MRKKLAFVVQRYGEEVNGGSEQYCRQVAEKLSSFYDVEVLTTCVVDYNEWKNKYKEGLYSVNGIRVRRFAVDKKRERRAFDALSAKVYGHRSFDNVGDEIRWMELQGPHCPRLIDYIKYNRDKYDVFIFMTYLYYTTFFGLQQVPEKSMLISTAHDEPPIYLDIFYPLFHLPRAMVYLTEEEKAFVNKKFNNDYKPSDVVGIGIDVPQDVNPQRFREKHGIDDDYIVYAGRIDQSKGCDELFEYFIRYKREHQSNLKLVMMGKPAMDIPKHKDILPLGFVSEEDKYDGMAGAKLLVLPSYFESLSMSVLESLGLGVPILVNGRCDVLKGHCIRSNAGLYYRGYYEFAECINVLLKKTDIYNKMSKNGLFYVSSHYTWDRVMDKYKALIDEL